MGAWTGGRAGCPYRLSTPHVSRLLARHCPGVLVPPALRTQPALCNAGTLRSASQPAKFGAVGGHTLRGGGRLGNELQVLRCVQRSQEQGWYDKVEGGAAIWMYHKVLLKATLHAGHPVAHLTNSAAHTAQHWNTHLHRQVRRQAIPVLLISLTVPCRHGKVWSSSWLCCGAPMKRQVRW